LRHLKRSLPLELELDELDDVVPLELDELLLVVPLELELDELDDELEELEVEVL